MASSNKVVCYLYNTPFLTYSLSLRKSNRCWIFLFLFVLIVHIDTEEIHELVKFCFWQCLSEMISNVSDACNVIDRELALFDSISQPKETHIHGF